jgi:glyoxylase-like metal-dependent hydrolase (beta-lactamase superfamily II)
MKQMLLLLLALAAAIGAWAQERYPITLVPPGKGPYTFPQGYQTPWEKIEMPVTEKLSPNLYIVHGSAGLDSTHPDGAGGRVAVLFGADGVLMVDTEDPQLASKTLDTIRTFTNAPIRIVVNSHIHSDHTGGNAFFGKLGATIYAQENLRDEMLNPPGRAGRVPDPAGVPSVTYRYSTPGSPAVTVHMNGETVDFIPMMPSHTAGDTIVRFNKANVIYIEDFYRNFGYPFADQANGGSIRGMIEAIDLIEKIAGDDTILIPGHGTLVTKKDLLPYRAMIVDILARVQKLRDQGKSVEEVLAANVTAPYDATTMGDTKESKDRFIGEVYAELKDFPPVVNGKRQMPGR